MARQVMEQIIQTGRVQRGRIGVSIQDPVAAGVPAGEGALIAEVSPGSPAETAGIRKGDLIVKVDGAPIRSAAQLRNKVGLTPVGKTVQLAVRRDGTVQNLDVEVALAENGVRASNGQRR
jgi:serine protease Do